MDADGQHSPDDALALAEALRRDRQTLLIGGRKFDAKVPLRSRFGNELTALIGKVFLGLTVSDTQSGMRGIPIQHVPALLGIRYDRFEFAIGLLIQCRRCRIPVRETPIQTIYIAGNASSHFNPLLDSMRIYFVLSRYIFATFAVVAVDYAIFIAAFPLTGSVVASTYAGRCVALFVQYFAGKNWVFYSKDSMTRSFPRYVLLVAVSGFISAALIRTLTEWTGIGVVLAKVVAELVLFPFNFTVQKELVFPSADREA
jgi:putative flippase GtrA